MALRAFKDSLESVPPELERNLTLIKDLDKNCLDAMNKVGKFIKKYDIYKSKEERDAIKIETSKLFDSIDSYSKHKIDLSKQLYELVDEQVEKLTNLNKSQNEVTNGTQLNPSHQESEAKIPGYRMPRISDEPVFCICRDISHGEMVQCDNEECPLEWFHFVCVGLVDKPKGKWFCRDCTLERQKTNHNKKRKRRFR